MSSLINDTGIPATRQEGEWQEEAWKHLLQERLPSEWQEQAVKHKAWQRTRSLKSIEHFLRALLVLTLHGYSFRQLGLWATVAGIGSLSERAWRKRLQRAHSWIHWLMGALIGTNSAPDWLPGSSAPQGAVYLVDATRLGMPAGTGEDVKVHSAYDLRAGRLAQVRITDRHAAEGMHHFELKAGDIVVTDAGYQVGSCVHATHQQAAFGVHRTSFQHLSIEREDGKTLSLKQLVKHQRDGTVAEWRVWLREPKRKQRYQVRLVIERLPRKQAMQARQKKATRLRLKQGKNYSRATVWWAGTLLLVSTLPQQEWSKQEIVKLYRSRWQIELVFKRLKQGLRLHRVTFKEWQRAQVQVELCLIAWSLQEEEGRHVRHALERSLQEPEVGQPTEQGEAQENEQPQWIVSSWGLMRCELDALGSLLQGPFSPQDVRRCWPQIQRYLVSKRRKKRIHQETEVRAWLLQRLVG